MSPSATAQQQAQQRLALSRQRLHEALRGIDSRHGPEGPGQPGSRQAPHGPSRPSASTLPQLALALGNRSLAPHARRHPWLLVLGAAAMGMVLAANRPWRWAPQALLAPGLVQPLRVPMLLPLLQPLLQPLLLRAAAQTLLGRWLDTPPPGPQEPAAERRAPH